METGERPTYSLADIAERFGGEIVGDPTVRITQVATLETAKAQHISFFSNPRYRRRLTRRTRARSWSVVRQPMLPFDRASFATIPTHTSRDCHVPQPDRGGCPRHASQRERRSYGQHRSKLQHRCPGCRRPGSSYRRSYPYSIGLKHRREGKHRRDCRIYANVSSIMIASSATVLFFIRAR